jgi:hypothetical protein
VKGTDVRAGNSAYSKGPLEHFIGGFVGESYRTNITWFDARVDKSGDSMCDDACFSAPGASNNKQRPFNMKDRLFL